MVDPKPNHQQPGGQGLTKLLLVYLVMSAIMTWLTMARFAVDEARLGHVEVTCSPK